MPRPKLEMVPETLRVALDHYMQGRASRRDVLRMACLLGLGSTGLLVGTNEAASRPVARGAANPRTGGELRVGLRVQKMGDPANFTWTDTEIVAGQVIEGLARTGQDGLVRPWLLSGWRPSEDLRKWTLNLRSGVRWSNGDPFNADDVIASFQRWCDGRHGSKMLTSLRSLSEGQGNKQRLRPGAVRKINQQTVEIRASEPFLTLPEVLAFLAAKVTHRSFEAGSNFSDAPIGTGPFNLVELDVGRHALLKARKDYWGPGPFVDHVRFLQLREKDGLSLYLSGNVDILLSVDIGQVANLPNSRRSELIEVPSANTAVARMRISEQPFNDLRVRKAIQMTLDRDAIRSAAIGDLGITGEDHHVSPVNPDYSRLPPLVRNVGRAKRLLAEAGHGRRLALTLNIIRSGQYGWHAAVGRALREQLREINIDLKLNLMESAKFWQSWNTTPFSITSWNGRPLGSMIYGLAYRSGELWNETRFSNNTFDSLLDEANRTVDLIERRKLMGRSQKILQDNAVILQPLWLPRLALVNPKVKGFELHPFQDLHAQEVWLEG